LLKSQSSFRFLDVACGDASSTARALSGSQVRGYEGVDLSPIAIALAQQTLHRVLTCPVELWQEDLVSALTRLEGPYDVVWIGLSLHHFRAAEKVSILRRIRRLAPSGKLVVYENASPDGETREGWMARWDAQRPDWTALSDDEWEAITAHVHAADYPETVTGWREIGNEAGFPSAQELFRCSRDLFRVFVFS
jgi:SAM-dependent methyltransferase